MIGYTTLGTNDLEKAVAFYDALFADLGLRKIEPNERLVMWSSKAGAAMLGIIKPFDGQAATPGNGTSGLRIASPRLLTSTSICPQHSSAESRVRCQSSALVASAVMVSIG